RRHTRFSRDWSSDVCSSDLLTRHAARIGAPVAVGTYGTGPGAGSWRNALAVVDPEGRPEAGYDKRRLVPLVERDALLWPALFDRSEERRVGEECGARRRRGE